MHKHVGSEACFGRSARELGNYGCQSTADCLSGLATFAGKAGHHLLASELDRANVHNIECNYREKHSHFGLDITPAAKAFGL
uniref:hypothetical protein n=1 Tax=Cupriavidus necator TaxID=106590 RepID=UPI003F49983B